MDYEEFEYNHEFSAETQEPADVAALKNSRQRTPLYQLPLAMAYVPMQRWCGTYDPCRALQRGTIFPELDLPFCGRGVK